MNGQQTNDRTIFGGWWPPRILMGSLLLLCCVWVYHPAMNRVFAADHISYLAELDGDTSLASGLRLLDYAAVRQYGKGDEILYRPLLMAWLAAQNAVFARNFRAWNAANLALHLLVSCLLFEVLWRIRRTPLACGVALLFSLLASNYEQVSWNHLGGYMLGYFLLLAALWAARESSLDGGRSARWVWAYGVAIMGAMLSHEIAVIAAFGFVIHGVACRFRKADTKWRRLITGWTVPILIYAALYVLHITRCERFLWVDPHSTSSGPPFSWILEIPGLLWRWFVNILLPVYNQLAVRVFWRSGLLSPAGVVPAVSLTAGLLWMGLLVCLLRGFSRQRLRDAWKFGALLVFLIVSYAGMNLIGRPYAVRVAYYAYFPALFGAVLLYSLIDFARIRCWKQVGALVCLAALSFVNGWQVYQTSCRIRTANEPQAQYYGWLEKTVRPRLSDPDFTFSIEGLPPAPDSKWMLALGYSDESILVEQPMAKFLYGKRYSSVSPTEVFIYPGTAGLSR